MATEEPVKESSQPSNEEEEEEGEEITTATDVDTEAVVQCENSVEQLEVTVIEAVEDDKSIDVNVSNLTISVNLKTLDFTVLVEPLTMVCYSCNNLLGIIIELFILNLFYLLIVFE